MLVSNFVRFKKNKIEVLSYNRLVKLDKNWLKSFFTKSIFPLLTPVAVVDPAHPFPFVPNLGLCMVLKLQKY